MEKGRKFPQKLNYFQQKMEKIIKYFTKKKTIFFCEPAKNVQTIFAKI